MKLWIKILTVALTVTSALAWSASAETVIVNWDGGIGGQNYVAGTGARSTNMRTPSGGFNINYGGDPDITDRQSITPFLSGSNPAVFSPSTNYPNGVDAVVYSTTFYGASESIILDAASGSVLGATTVRDADGLGAHINIGSNATVGILTSAVLFRKENFLGNLGGDSFKLDSMSISLAVCTNMRGRWLVQNGDYFYVSSATFTASASLSDFTTSTWSLYDLAGASGGVQTLNYQPTVFDPINFDDIRGIGFYTETWDGVDQICANGTLRVTDFIGTAAIIPEPSTISLICGGLLLMAGCAYCRRKESIAAMKPLFGGLLTLLVTVSVALAADPPPSWPLESPVINSPDIAAWKNATMRPVAPDGKHSIHSYFNASPESPDGKYVLYFSSTAASGEFGNITVIERATGAEKVVASGVTTEDAHRVACQQWIDGGKKIAYHDLRDGVWRVHVVDLASGENKMLAEERLLCFGAPNSKWLPLYGYHWKQGAHRDFEMVNVDTGEIKTVATVSGLLAEHGGLVRELVGEGEVSLFFPVVSPDGKRAMCKIARGKGGDTHRGKVSERLGKFVYDLENGRWLAAVRFWGHPAWFPDGNAIIERGISVQYLDGRPNARFAVGCIGDHQSVSPDGKYFTADADITKRAGAQPGDWGVAVGEFATNEYVTVHRFTLKGGAASWRKSHPHPAFSADGQRVYFNVNDGPWTRVYVAEKAGAN
ncbi:MAG: MprA protease, GlyGly-CTERM protein-sorting domain-containing form [Verrucomicrobiales bacterium]|jgi:MprA protease rhombosortase-interaction domain-containing protein|nr:MprA protease, GlyGly-CTERM protein-sorting domain-containing form [Verrucomicrobiales bacterium]